MKISQNIQLKKTASWTVISWSITTTLTFFVTWYVTGNIYSGIGVGLGIGIVDRIIKIPSYYGHERLWHKKYKVAKANGKST